MKKKLKLNNLFMNLYLVLLLFTSISSSLTLKVQQRCVVDGVQYNHPLMQVVIMFIGEVLNYLNFIFYKWRHRGEYEAQKKYEVEKMGKIENVNKLIFAIPAFIDFFGSFITLVAMSMLPFSFYYMIRGGNIIITAIFSIIFLKKILHKHNFVGLLLNFLGFLTVGISAILTSDTDQDSTYLIVGVVLIIVTFFTTTCQLVFEELLFKKYYLHPLEVVGWEGFWGIIISLIGLALFSNIPCISNAQQCPDGKMENVPQFFESVFNLNGSDQPTLIIMIFLSMFFMMMLNGFSLTVTKYAGCLTRTVVTAVAPFIVWMFTISIGWDDFNYGQFAGYTILSVGALIYCEVLVIPFCGLDSFKNIQNGKILMKIPDQKQSSAQSPIPTTARKCLFVTTCSENLNTETEKMTN
ncbi:hypothetical protein ABPG72_005019 [Tetrahymena utriculariae]